MLPAPTIFLITIAAVILFVVIVIASTGSIAAGLVLLVLMALLGVILSQMGILKIDFQDGGMDISFFEKAPAPSPQPTSIIPASLEPKEVFYVSGNDYTYDEAAAVCAAYDADLATYDQVNTAYSGGAEWCGYGWTQGGMALYPTQEDTWEAMQKETDATKRTGCGRPGINGGYFDPSNKFGVNCYGTKPSMGKGIKFPLPVPGMDAGNFNRMVDKFKGMLSRMTVSPFNRQEWSVSGTPSTGSGHSSKKSDYNFIQQQMSSSNPHLTSMSKSDIIDWISQHANITGIQMAVLQKLDKKGVIAAAQQVENTGRLV